MTEQRGIQKGFLPILELKGLDESATCQQRISCSMYKFDFSPNEKID